MKYKTLQVHDKLELTNNKSIRDITDLNYTFRDDMYINETYEDFNCQSVPCKSVRDGNGDNETY